MDTDRELVRIEAGRVYMFHPVVADGVELLESVAVPQDAQADLVFSDNSYRQYIITADTFERLKAMAGTEQPWSSVVEQLVDDIVRNGHLIEDDQPNYNPPERYPDRHIPLHNRRRGCEYVSFSADDHHEVELFTLDVEAVNAARRSNAGQPADSAPFKIRGV